VNTYEGSKIVSRYNTYRPDPHWIPLLPDPRISNQTKTTIGSDVTNSPVTIAVGIERIPPVNTVTVELPKKDRAEIRAIKRIQI